MTLVILLSIIMANVMLSSTFDELLLEVKAQNLPQRNNEDNIKNRNTSKASPQTITHFFSHIPKAGGQYAWQEVLRLFQSTVVHPNNCTDTDIQSAQERFYQYHKNKTNGSDFFISTGDEDWNNFPVDLEGTTDTYTPSKLCQWGLAPLDKIKPYQIIKNRNGSRIRVKCNIVVTERPWQDNIKNVYTIVREPLSHVLSQYFHCTESSSHNSTIVIDGQEINKLDLMPSLDKWLQTYDDLYNQSSFISQKELDKKIKQMFRRFNCYNPWSQFKSSSRNHHNIYYMTPN